MRKGVCHRCALLSGGADETLAGATLVDGKTHRWKYPAEQVVCWIPDPVNLVCLRCGKLRGKQLRASSVMSA